MEPDIPSPKLLRSLAKYARLCAAAFRQLAAKQAASGEPTKVTCACAAAEERIAKAAEAMTKTVKALASARHPASVAALHDKLKAEWRELSAAVAVVERNPAADLAERAAKN